MLIAWMLGGAWVFENYNLSIRFSETREIFPSVNQVLSIFLTTAVTSASVESCILRERVA